MQSVLVVELDGPRPRTVGCVALCAIDIALHDIRCSASMLFAMTAANCEMHKYLCLPC